MANILEERGLQEDGGGSSAGGRDSRDNDFMKYFGRCRCPAIVI